MFKPAVLQQEEVTWRCCSGRGRTAASGMPAPVVLQHEEVTWRCCSGRGRTAARGMLTLAILQQQQVTWRCCSGLARTAVRKYSKKIHGSEHHGSSEYHTLESTQVRCSHKNSRHFFPRRLALTCRLATFCGPRCAALRGRQRSVRARRVIVAISGAEKEKSLSQQPSLFPGMPRSKSTMVGVTTSYHRLSTGYTCIFTAGIPP